MSDRYRQSTGMLTVAMFVGYSDEIPWMYGALQFTVQRTVGFVSFDVQALTRLIDVASCRECFFGDAIHDTVARDGEVGYEVSSV